MVKSGKYWSFDEDTGELKLQEDVREMWQEDDYWNDNKYWMLEPEEKIPNEFLEDIKSIKFSSSIIIDSGETINNWNKLENISFSKCDEGFIRIGMLVFAGCFSLKNIEWNDLSGVEIETEAFAYCRSLKEVRLPKRLQDLGKKAFGYCTGLEKIYIPQSITQRIPNVSELATQGNNAQVIFVNDDFKMSYEDKETFEENSTTSNEVAKIQTNSKIQMPKSYCGVIRPNLLAKRKGNKNSNGKVH